MNPSHQGMAIPIGPMGGIITAPGPGGPVGIGIGVPLMPATASAQMMPQMGQYTSSSGPNNFVTNSDSSDSKDKMMVQMLGSKTGPSAQFSPASSANPMAWSNQLVSASSPAMTYPVMGMSMLGTAQTGLSDGGIIYGLIGSGASGPCASINISNPSTSISHQSTFVGLPQLANPMMPEPLQREPSLECITLPKAKSPESPVTTPTQHPAKEIIHCKACTLFPPNPSAPIPTTREKPPGCRTVFVGGLPEHITEEIIREIFQKCGEIITVRMSKKNFCHIRFEFEESIETAITLSGYRIRIGSNSDLANIGRLHVDYAQARDDLFEYECRQRQQLREQRHKERIEKERLLPPSPPSASPYSEHEAAAVAERIKSDEGFIKGIQMLIAWLEKGDCNKRNSTTFYSMIQSSNSHIRRLLHEKSQYGEELQRAKDLMRQRIGGLLIQLSHIERVFSSACHKKAWDHFSRAQRKNIETWKIQAADMKTSLMEDAFAERMDEEMDLSDEETGAEEASDNGEVPAKKAKREDRRTMDHLREEYDSLRCQLEASRNEVDMVKVDLRSELEAKDAQLRALREQLDGQVMLAKGLQIQRSSDTLESNQGTSQQSIDSYAQQCDSSSSGVRGLAEDLHGNHMKTHATDNHNHGANHPNETEAKLIAIVSVFIHLHPFGAGLDSVLSYTRHILPDIQVTEIEALFRNFPGIFRLEGNLCKFAI